MWVDVQYSNILINEISVDEKLHSYTLHGVTSKKEQILILFENVTATTQLEITKGKTVMGIGNQRDGDKIRYFIYLKECTEKPTVVADAVSRLA